MTPSITFTCTLVEGAMSAIPVEFDQRAVFGKARPPVVVTLGDYSYRSTVAIMKGFTFVPLRRSHREAAGIAPGQTIEVTLTLDTASRAVAPPDDAAAAIDAAGLRAAWDALSYTHQREHVEAIDGAKRAETRAKRIGAMLAMLGERALP